MFFLNDPATTEIYTLPYATLVRSAGGEGGGAGGDEGEEGGGAGVGVGVAGACGIIATDT